MSLCKKKSRACYAFVYLLYVILIKSKDNKTLKLVLIRIYKRDFFRSICQHKLLPFCSSDY